MGTLTRKAFDRKLMPEYPFDIGYRWVKNGSVMVQVPLTEEDFLHPQEEDRFLFCDAHTRAMTDMRRVLQLELRTRTDVHVFTNHRIDWQTCGIRPMGPDVVVLGDFREKWDSHRGTVPVHEMGLKTLLVAEITWKSTRHIDLEQKPPLYHRLGVPYLLVLDFFSGDSENLESELHAFRATQQGYVRIDADPAFGVWIPTVDLWIKLDALQVVMHNADNEVHMNQKQLDALLAHRKKNFEFRVADTDRNRKRAEAEKQRADALEKELAELRAKLAHQPTKKNGHK